jgi:hypothetical protein
MVHVFISHNKKQKSSARTLALALVENGASVWFDEWNLRPGDSLTGGIEEGLTQANVFVLLWSKEAAKSNWVGTEVRAYLRRRVDDKTLHIVPILVDDTPLPTLVADYKGYVVRSSRSLGGVAADISGNSSEAKLVQRLIKRLDELTIDEDARNDPLPYKRCPQCGSDQLERKSALDPRDDDMYYFIGCTECGWGEWSQ